MPLLSRAAFSNFPTLDRTVTNIFHFFFIFLGHFFSNSGRLRSAFRATPNGHEGRECTLRVGASEQKVGSPSTWERAQWDTNSGAHTCCPDACRVVGEGGMVRVLRTGGNGALAPASRRTVRGTVAPQEEATKTEVASKTDSGGASSSKEAPAAKRRGRPKATAVKGAAPKSKSTVVLKRVAPTASVRKARAVSRVVYPESAPARQTQGSKAAASAASPVAEGSDGASIERGALKTRLRIEKEAKKAEKAARRTEREARRAEKEARRVGKKGEKATADEGAGMGSRFGEIYDFVDNQIMERMLLGMTWEAAAKYMHDRAAGGGDEKILLQVDQAISALRNRKAQVVAKKRALKGERIPLAESADIDMGEPSNANVQEEIITPKTYERKVKNQAWTLEETECLFEGVRKHGIGKWNEIMNEFFGNRRAQWIRGAAEGGFPERDAVSLKDRWRNLVKCTKRLVKDENHVWRSKSITKEMLVEVAMWASGELKPQPPDYYPEE